MAAKNREPSIWFMPWRWPLKFQLLAAALLVILWLTTMFALSVVEEWYGAIGQPVLPGHSREMSSAGERV